MYGTYMIPVCVYPQSINTVYDRRGYREVVERVAEESMQKAVEEVKAQPDYSSTGEVMYMYMYIHVFMILYLHTYMHNELFSLLCDDTQLVYFLPCSG